MISRLFEKEGNPKKNNPNSSGEFIIIYFIGFLPVIYSLIRAYSLSFTHDESLTYNLFSTQTFWEIITYKSGSANIHLLNSLLMEVFGYIFNDAEFFLRLPVVIAHGLYVYYFIKIFRLFNLSLFQSLIGVILINANPYFLEFFSLARGYGLGHGLLIIMIYYYLAYIKTGINNKRILAYIISFFMVISQFVFFYLWTSFVLADFLITLFYQKKQTVKKLFRHYIIVFPVILFTLLSVLFPVLSLHEAGQIKSRWVSGFWNNTVRSFIDGFLLHEPTESQFTFSMILLVIILLFIFTSLIILVTSKNTRKNPVYFILLVLLAGTPLLSILHNSITGAEFLVYRKTLFFYPILTINLLLISLRQNKSFKCIIAYPFLSVVSTILLIHTVFNINTRYAAEWKYDASTKEMLNDLKEINKKDNGKKPVVLGITWYFEPTINYYIKSRNLQWIKPVNRYSTPKLYDYFYLKNSYYYPHEISADTLQIIKNYPISDTFLAKINHQHPHE